MAEQLDGLLMAGLSHSKSQFHRRKAAICRRQVTKISLTWPTAGCLMTKNWSNELLAFL